MHRKRPRPALILALIALVFALTACGNWTPADPMPANLPGYVYYLVHEHNTVALWRERPNGQEPTKLAGGLADVKSYSVYPGFILADTGKGIVRITAGGTVEDLKLPVAGTSFYRLQAEPEHAYIHIRYSLFRVDQTGAPTPLLTGGGHVLRLSLTSNMILFQQEDTNQLYLVHPGQNGEPKLLGTIEPMKHIWGSHYALGEPRYYPLIVEAKAGPVYTYIVDLQQGTMAPKFNGHAYAFDADKVVVNPLRGRAWRVTSYTKLKSGVDFDPSSPVWKEANQQPYFQQSGYPFGFSGVVTSDANSKQSSYAIFPDRGLVFPVKQGIAKTDGLHLVRLGDDILHLYTPAKGPLELLRITPTGIQPVKVPNIHFPNPTAPSYDVRPSGLIGRFEWGLLSEIGLLNATGYHTLAPGARQFDRAYSPDQKSEFMVLSYSARSTDTAAMSTYLVRLADGKNWLIAPKGYNNSWNAY